MIESRRLLRVLPVGLAGLVVAVLTIGGVGLSGAASAASAGGGGVVIGTNDSGGQCSNCPNQM